MIMTESGLYIPASEVAHIKDGYAYLFNGARVELKVVVNTKMK